MDLIKRVRRFVERAVAPVIPTDITQANPQIPPREALKALRQVAVQTGDGWVAASEEDMALSKEDILSNLIKAKSAKAGKVVPDDAPDPDEEEPEVEEEETEEETEEAVYDLAKPLNRWTVEACAAYLGEVGMPTSGTVKELRKAVEFVMKSKGQVQDPEPDKAAAKSTMQRKIEKTQAAVKTKKVEKPAPKDEPDPDEDTASVVARKLAAKKAKAAEPEPEPEPKAEKKAKKAKAAAKAKKQTTEEVEADTDAAIRERVATLKPGTPEPGSKWGDFELLIDTFPLKQGDGKEVVFLTDLLEEARHFVATSDEPKRKDWLSKIEHWNSADYNRGGSMVAGVFSSLLDEGIVSIDGCVVVCNSREPGQEDVIQVLFPKAPIVHGRFTF